MRKIENIEAITIYIKEGILEIRWDGKTEEMKLDREKVSALGEFIVVNELEEKVRLKGERE